MLQGIPSMMVSKYGVSAPSNGFYRSITLDQPASDLTDFPVLVTGTYTYLKTISNGGKVNNASGFDITFYSDSGLTSLLNFERVYWDATTGACEFRIKVPTLTNASALVIYMAYGKTSISTDQQNITGTWNSNYLGVWHMGSPSTLSLADSIGTANGSNSGVQAATGTLGGAAFFDGSSNADFGNHDDFTTGSFTISFWAKTTTSNGGRLIAKGSEATNGYIVYMNNTQGSNFSPWLYAQTGASDWYQAGPDLVNYTDGVWRQFVYVRSGGSSNTYTNNVLNSGSQQGGSGMGTLTNSDSLIMGSQDDGGSKYTGYMDEVKIENTIRSANWRAAVYSNESDPANFYVIGSETPV